MIFGRWNLKEIWYKKFIVLLKMTFWISQGKVTTADRWDGQIYKLFMSIFFQISHTQNN